MRSKAIKFQKGLSLIELLVAIVIMGVLGVGFLGLQFLLSKNQEVVFRSFLTIDDANKSINEFVRELRTVRSGDDGSYAIESVSDQEIIFYSDVDFDGQTEKVRYFLSGNEFHKGVTEPTTPPISYPETDEKVSLLSDIIRNGSNPIFFFYNSDWPLDTINNPLSLPTDLSNIKTVRINIRTNPVPNKSNKDFVLESYVNLRTLKENL